MRSLKALKKNRQPTAGSTVPVKTLAVSAYRVPTDYPESDGTFAWEATTMVLVELSGGGQEGIGYTYADESVGRLIDQSLRDLILEADALDPLLLQARLIRAIRNLGPGGLAMMAVSAVDIAVWDLKAKLHGLPLAALLGRTRDAVPLYGSGGFTSYPPARLQAQLGGWAGAGFREVKMKVGREPGKDPLRVRQAREAIGTDTALFIDANGAYAIKQALGLADHFSEEGVTWFEEPVPSADRSGLSFIRGRLPAPMRVAAGEYGAATADFGDLLSAGAVDVLQADATRCGGISGFLKAGALAEAARVPFSSHCAPAVHMQAALSTPGFLTAEYFHDHVRIETLFFDGMAPPRDGTWYAEPGRPGLGITLKTSDADRYRI